jgi:hypothetical protein
VRAQAPFDWLDGRYSNEAQYAAASAQLKRPPAAGHPYDWIDLQDAVFARIEAPAIDGRAYYLEWRSNGPDGPISRQRIWTFTRQADAAWRMDFYTFRMPQRFAGKARMSDAFLTLTPADLIGYPAGCSLAFQQTGPAVWRGEIDPHTCLITAQSGRRMRISAAITIEPGWITYAEAGQLESGAYAFKVPGGPAYLFQRLADAAQPQRRKPSNGSRASLSSKPR